MKTKEQRIRISEDCKNKIKVETAKRKMVSMGEFVEKSANYIIKNKIEL